MVVVYWMVIIKSGTVIINKILKLHVIKVYGTPNIKVVNKMTHHNKTPLYLIEEIYK